MFAISDITIRYRSARLSVFCCISKRFYPSTFNPLTGQRGLTPHLYQPDPRDTRTPYTRIALCHGTQATDASPSSLSSSRFRANDSHRLQRITFETLILSLIKLAAASKKCSSPDFLSLRARIIILNLFGLCSEQRGGTCATLHQMREANKFHIIYDKSLWGSCNTLVNITLVIKLLHFLGKDGNKSQRRANKILIFL